MQTTVSRVARRAGAASRGLSTLVHPPPLYITDSKGAVLSPWHDLPIRPAAAAGASSGSSSDPAVFTFVNEITRGSRPKMEIATDLPGNPIIQDKTKKGEPRFYAMDSLVNYGAIPQTYEDPDHKDAWTNLLGDGDPIDVCEIGSKLAKTGDVYSVKVLGALAMLDGGETDWKVLAVRTDDPLAAKVSDVANANTPDAVKKAMDDIREWFRTYKIPEGKGENSFAFEGRWLDLPTTLAIIESTHKQWKSTVDKRTGVQEKKQPWLPAVNWKPYAGSLAGKGSDFAVGNTTNKPANF